ncbi:TonB-dependent receptor plug domain-containing protein [Massilia litorea]|uniref:TonB-dependent receptor n=1 Tax=Massilia litorea TaxID=2769491 RepID=A0A7L9U423_9BURK|nr:TonB-dependent receptor [Massilia litorea]QOL49169.1 TonB-dependent receptor [Massilia litorea]
MLSSLRMTLLAAALASAFPALAQETAGAAPKADAAADQKMQKVEVRGTADSYDARRDDTATKIVVTQVEIAKYGDTSVVDVLKRVPGITVSTPNGRGGEIRMRGLGAGYTQILINGERAPGGFTIDSLSPDVIERIEVLRAASAEFSTQSVAGTVNIVLKKTVRSGQREFKLGARTGSGFQGPTANLQLSDKLGTMSYSVAASVMAEQFSRRGVSDEQAFDPAGQPVQVRHADGHEDGRLKLFNLAPRLNWTLEGGDTLTSQSFVNSARFRNHNQDVNTTSLGPATPYPVLDSAVRSDNDVLRTELNWVHKMADGAKLDVKASLIGGQNTTDNRRWTPPGAARPIDNLVHLEADERGTTTVGKFSKTIMKDHALGMGWDGGYSRRTDSREEFEAGNRVFPALPKGEESESRVGRLALYAQDEWNLTPRWSLYLGARWEGIRTTTSGNTFATGRSRSSVWSPVLQTLWKIPETKGDQVRFAVTRTYKAPSFQQLIPRRQTSIDNRSTDPDYAGNPDLQPELALGFDASYEHYWAEGALFSLSASTRRIDGYTRYLVDFDGARWVAMPMNAGRAVTRGVELETKFPLKAVMKDAPAIDLRASLSANWSRVDGVPGPDNRLDGQAPLAGNLGIDYKRAALTTGASFAWKQGGQIRVSERQTTTLQARRDLEAYALYKFNPKQQLRVALSNLLGQDFVNRGSFAEEGRGLVLREARIEAGPSLRATLELKF